MSTCIAHRGPDGEGIELIHTPRAVAGLVHRRLAVLDPDPRSNQPFLTEYAGRRLWLTYNGEIYNYRALRKELEPLLPGFPWRTSGDTEVVLAAYFAWGEACVDRMLGMFALVVFEESNGNVFLARDRMGQKPLYYALAPKRGVGDGMSRGEEVGGWGGVAFASEISALTALPWVDLTVSESALSNYLAYGYTGPVESIYVGIRKLPPSCRMNLSGGAGDAEPVSYFDRNRAEPGGDPVERTRQLLTEAVASQLVSDVPLGCFLSGGIDSSVVSLLAAEALRRQGGGPLKTFTARFEDARYDESKYAEQVARHLGTEHHTFTITPDAAADLSLLALSYGEPFADSSCLPTYYLARETRGHVKVALAGDGGDELFAGYDRYRAMALAQKIGWMGHLMGVIPDRLAEGPPKSMLTRLGRFFASARLSAGKRYEAWMRIFPPGLCGAPGLTGRIAGVELPSGDVVRASLALDRVTYLDADLLTKADRASMLVNLEVRAPFMDHHLVAFASGLSRGELLTGGKKGLLRKAFAHQLPKAVFTRRKMGFAVPIGEWFRSSLKEMLRSHLLAHDGFAIQRFGVEAVESLLIQHDTKHVDHTHRLFALLMLELWFQNSARYRNLSG